MKDIDIQKQMVKAQEYFESGDPEQAVGALETVSLLCPPHDVKRLVWKAKYEAEIGSPERAETHIWMAICKLKPSRRESSK